VHCVAISRGGIVFVIGADVGETEENVRVRVLTCTVDCYTRKMRLLLRTDQIPFQFRGLLHAVLDAFAGRRKSAGRPIVYSCRRFT